MSGRRRGGKRGYGSEKIILIFSHSGRIPKDEYLENNVPYSIAQIRKTYGRKEAEAPITEAGGEVNKVYPSKRSFIFIRCTGEIFGQVEQGRMITMEKKRHCSEK